MTDIPTLTPEKIITKITNKKTGEVYETEEALKAANKSRGGMITVTSLLTSSSGILAAFKASSVSYTSPVFLLLILVIIFSGVITGIFSIMLLPLS